MIGQILSIYHFSLFVSTFYEQIQDPPPFIGPIFEADKGRTIKKANVVLASALFFYKEKSISYSLLYLTKFVVSLNETLTMLT